MRVSRSSRCLTNASALKRVLFSCFIVSVIVVGNCQANFFQTTSATTAARILSACGYIVEENFVTTNDDRELLLTRASNPLINKGDVSGHKDKDPILFIHGILENESVFVVNSKGVKPADFSKLDVQRVKSYASHPSTKSLPILALNFGHTVYLLSRRGTPGSQNSRSSIPIQRNRPEDFETFNSLLRNLTDPTDENSRNSGDGVSSVILSGMAALQKNLFGDILFKNRQWDYSFDEQIEHDFPRVVDFILKQTNRRKLAVVGHSAGGTITLGALSRSRKIAKKLSAAIFWAEGMSLGHNDVFVTLAPFERLLDFYVGPLPSQTKTSLFQSATGFICRLPFLQRTFCETFLDVFLGDSGGKEPATPENLNTILFPTSSHEFAQLMQCVRQNGRMHKYDYGKAVNLIKYKREKPPLYNITRIKFRKMSFYTSKNDRVVSELDAEATRKQLKGECKSSKQQQNNLQTEH